MAEIIKSLQNIQENLVGIILPVIITAFVSLMTILSNVYIQIKLHNCKFNNEQYKLMQDLYPKLKYHLIRLKLSMEDIERSQLYLSLGNALDKYMSFRSNESKYRKQNTDEVQEIDYFAEVMKKHSENLLELYDYLFKCNLPMVPIGHFIFKKKVNKMIAVLQYYSLLLNINNEKALNDNFFDVEIKKIEEIWKIKFNSLLIEKYLFLLDKWLIIY